MADERGESKRLAVSMAVGMFAAQVVGGPSDQSLAHVPFYAKPLIKGVVAGVASLIGCSIAGWAWRRPQGLTRRWIRRRLSSSGGVGHWVRR